MPSTPNPKPTDPHNVLEIAPGVVLVARADKKSSNLGHDAMSRPLNSRPRTASDFTAGPSALPVDTKFRAAADSDVQVPGDRPSIGRRAIRAFIGFLLAVCIGVAATVWQAYGDTAKQIIAGWAPQLGLTSSAPPENPGLAEQSNPAAVQAGANAAAGQPGAAPTTTATFTPESAQLLQSMAGDLARAEQEIEQLKASVAQLKANQQQIFRDPAKPSEGKASGAKASEQNLRRPRITAPPRRAAATPARKPMPPFPAPQAAAALRLTQAAPTAQLPPEPQPQAPVQPQAELVPRPPMPLR